MKAMFRLMRICLLFFAGAIAPVAVLAFPCETDFGTIEIPELPGYVHARESVVKGIQKNKESGGARDKLLFVLVREEEADWERNLTDIIQLSRIPLDKPLADKDFESLADAMKGQFPEGIKSLAPNAIHGPSHKERNLFYASVDFPMEGTLFTGTFRMISGGLRIRGRLVSFLFMLTTPTSDRIMKLERFLRDIRDNNNYDFPSTSQHVAKRPIQGRGEEGCSTKAATATSVMSNEEAEAARMKRETLEQAHFSERLAALDHYGEVDNLMTAEYARTEGAKLVGLLLVGQELTPEQVHTFLNGKDPDIDARRLISFFGRKGARTLRGADELDLEDAVRDVRKKAKEAVDTSGMDETEAHAARETAALRAEESVYLQYGESGKDFSERFRSLLLYIGWKLAYLVQKRDALLGTSLSSGNQHSANASNANTSPRGTECDYSVNRPLPDAEDAFQRVDFSHALDLLKEPTTRLRTLGMDKAGGIDLQIDYPQSMTAKPGHQPHIVQVISTRLGDYRFDVHLLVAPLTADSVTPMALAAKTTDKKIIDDFAASPARADAEESSADVSDFGSLRISNLNVYWRIASMQHERLGILANQIAMSFLFPSVNGNNLYVNFILSNSTLDNAGKQLPTIPMSDFKALYPLIMRILNSLTFMDKTQIAGDVFHGNRAGTAWFMSPTHLVTCWHVVNGGTLFSFTDADHRKIDLTLVAKDEFADLAVLRVASPNYRALQWLPISMRPAQVADWVCTVGYPHPDLLGQEAKFTEGVVSALSGPDGAGDTFIQMTTPVQMGNSGGPLVNERGEVAGIVSMKSQFLDLIAGDRLQNVNFAVKADRLLALLEKSDIKADCNTSGKSLSRSELFGKVKGAVVFLQVNFPSIPPPTEKDGNGGTDEM